MPESTLHLERDGAVAELVLGGKRGALGPDAWNDLPRLLHGARAARALIVRGAGADFSVGLDLARMAPALASVRADERAFDALIARMQEAVEALADFPAPVIAAVSGWCIGAGLELALACDVRVCDASARFSLPEVKLGIVSDLGGLGRLAHTVGEGWARRLALTGEAVDAARAERIGLVSEVLPSPGDALAQARKLAEDAAKLDARALDGVKRVMNGRVREDMERHYREARAWNVTHLDLGNVRLPNRPSVSVEEA